MARNERREERKRLLETLPRLSRAQAIKAVCVYWGLSAIDHSPIHAHLAMDTKTFDQDYLIGRASEDLAFPLLAEQFAEYSLVPNCEATRETRPEGKRVFVQGAWRILPDYDLGFSSGMGFYLDIKGKQYHSYYHLQSRVEQFVDKYPVDDYVTVANSMQKPCLILFHLVPAVILHRFGKGLTARIHTGYKQPLLALDVLQDLVQRFPVDDAYYLASAHAIQREGRLGINRKGVPGYYFPVTSMIPGPGNGRLPPRKAFRRLVEEQRSLF